MDCLRFEQLLQRWLDADLGPAHARRMEEHSARCAPCATARGEYRALFDALAHLEREPAPPDLEAAVLARIDTRAFRPPARERLLRLLVHPENMLPSPAQMGLAAALVLGLLCAGTGRLGAWGAHFQDGLGRAATWTYTWTSGILAESWARFLAENWPMIRDTAATLLGATRLVVGEQRGILALTLLAATCLLACARALRRARGGRHASLHLV